MIYLITFIYLIILSIHYDLNSRRLGPFEGSIASGKINLVIVYVIFIYIAGFRDGIGSDTANYVKQYAETPDIYSIKWSYVSTHIHQPLWVYTTSLCKTICPDYTFFQILHASFINFVIIYFLKKVAPRYIFTCLTLFFILNYLEFNMEIARESLAVCFGLLAYRQYYRKRYVGSLLLWIIAFGYHVSAIAILLYPFFGRMQYNRRKVFMFAFLASIILVIYPYLPNLETYLLMLTRDNQEMIDRYSQTQVDKSLNLFYFLQLFMKNVIIPVAAMLYLKKRGNRFLGFAMAFTILNVMNAISYAFYRFGNYYSLFYIIFISHSIIIYLKSKKWIFNLRHIYFTIIILCFLYLYQGYELKKCNSNGYIYFYDRYYPYKSVFTEK